MSKRERFSHTIACPKCGHVGNVELSEFENPVHTGGVLGTQFESILSGNFKYENGRFACLECGKVFLDES